MNILEFKKMALSSTESLFSFSRFVNQTESLLENIETGPVNKLDFQNIWFELETINALALDEWECDGKPKNWAVKWNERYKEEAIHVINDFFSLMK